MKLKIVFLFLFFTSLVSAQTGKISVEAAFPSPIDQNFLGDHFKGIADLGIKYRIKNLQVITFGLSLNGSMFTHNATEYFPAADENLSFKTTLYMIQPRAYAELNLKIIKIRPFVGVGYSFLTAERKFDSQSEVPDDSTTQSGVNVNIGFAYNVFTKIYFFTSYDFITLTHLDSGVPSNTYNTKASVLKLGVGIRL